MLSTAARERQNHRTQSQVDAAAQLGVTAMSKKEEMAIAIALQTQVLKACPIHNQVYCCDDGEEGRDDENMARAFAVAVDLVRQHQPCAAIFHHDAHELTDLLSYTIGAAPLCCPDCMRAREPATRRPDQRESVGAARGS